MLSIAFLRISFLPYLIDASVASFDFSIVSHLNTSIPIYIWSDVLYTTYYRHYYRSLNISKNTSKDIRYLEKILKYL